MANRWLSWVPALVIGFVAMEQSVARAAPEIDPHGMKIGQSGRIVLYGETSLTVAEVGDDWLAIKCTSGFPTYYFLVRGVPTKGVVTDKRWDHKGEWKVEDTEKYQGKTVFVLRPHKPKDKK